MSSRDPVRSRLALLLEHPSEALLQEPLVVPRSRDWVLAGVLMAAGVLGVFIDASGPAYGVIVLALGLSLPFLWTSSLTLTRDGVQFGRTQKHLFVPWSAIDTEREAIVSSMNFLTYAVALPLLRAERDRVELREDGKLKGRGLMASLGFASLVTGDEVRLTGRVQGGFARISPVLMHVARALGKAGARSERAEAPPSPVHAPRFEPSILKREGQNGVSYPLSFRPFPALCCECGNDTPEETVFEAFGGFGRWGALAGSSLRLSVSVPHCTACGEKLRRRFRRVERTGAGVGAILGFVMPLVWYAFGSIDAVGRNIALVILPILGALIGSLAGNFVPLPVKVKGSFDGKRVTTLVKNPAIAARYLAVMFPAER